MGTAELRECMKPRGRVAGGSGPLSRRTLNTSPDEELDEACAKRKQPLRTGQRKTTVRRRLRCHYLSADIDVTRGLPGSGNPFHGLDLLINVRGPCCEVDHEHVVLLAHLS